MGISSSLTPSLLSLCTVCVWVRRATLVFVRVCLRCSHTVSSAGSWPRPISLSAELIGHCRLRPQRCRLCSGHRCPAQHRSLDSRHCLLPSLDHNWCLNYLYFCLTVSCLFGVLEHKCLSKCSLKWVWYVCNTLNRRRWDPQCFSG